MHSHPVIDAGWSKCKICWLLQISGDCAGYWVVRWQRNSDNCDINIAQQTSCELLFPDVQMQLKMCFFIPSVHPCVHHNCGVISGRDYMWPITFGCRAYTTCCGGRVLAVVIRFNATFLSLRPYWEKMCTCFFKDAESLTTYGCALGCSQILILWTLQPHFYLWLSARAFWCLFV